MFRIVDSGDESLIVYLAEMPGEEALHRVMAFAQCVRAELSHWIVDLVPSYCCVAVYFDLLQCNYAELRDALQRLASRLEDCEAGRGNVAAERRPHTVELPVYYGHEAAPDLLRVAEQAGLSCEAVVQAHTAQSYRVYALGFRPGFAFMGETPEVLRLPRLDTPRQRVPAGAVAIAEAQTAIYPTASPGGWNLIGRCPLTLFRLEDTVPHVHLRVGDLVRFTPVTRSQYLSLGGQLDE